MVPIRYECFTNILKNLKFVGVVYNHYYKNVTFLFSSSILSKKMFSPSSCNRFNVLGTNNDDLKKQSLLFLLTKKESQGEMSDRVQFRYPHLLLTFEVLHLVRPFFQMSPRNPGDHLV